MGWVGCSQFEYLMDTVLAGVHVRLNLFEFLKLSKLGVTCSLNMSGSCLACFSRLFKFDRICIVSLPGWELLYPA